MTEGTSDYQAAWIIESEEEGSDGSGDESQDGEGEESRMGSDGESEGSDMNMDDTVRGAETLEAILFLIFL